MPPASSHRPAAVARSRSCELRDSLDARATDATDADKENVDANVQQHSSASSEKALGASSKRKRGAASASSTLNHSARDAHTKRTKRTKPSAAAAATDAQAASEGGSQETPPSFAFTRGKQTFRKRKQRAEQLKQQESDQKRLDELVQFFKHVDATELKFAASE